MEESKKETITILKVKYDELVKEVAWLRCLESAGVDSWEGYDMAIDLYNADDDNV